MGALLLLSAGFWSKQTAGAAALAAGLWIGIALAAGWVTKRRAALFLGLLLFFNLAILALLNAITGGWEWYFNFVLPTRQSQIYHGVFLGDL